MTTQAQPNVPRFWQRPRFWVPLAILALLLIPLSSLKTLEADPRITRIDFAQIIPGVRAERRSGQTTLEYGQRLPVDIELRHELPEAHLYIKGQWSETDSPLQGRRNAASSPEIELGNEAIYLHPRGPSTLELIYRRYNLNIHFHYWSRAPQAESEKPILEAFVKSIDDAILRGGPAVQLEKQSKFKILAQSFAFPIRVVASLVFGYWWMLFIGLCVTLLVWGATKLSGLFFRATLRCLCFSLFFAPGLVAGHGIAIVPAIMALVIFVKEGETSMAFSFAFVPMVVTFAVASVLYYLTFFIRKTFTK